MNIVFWSQCQGKCATSYNTLAVSIMSALVYSVEGTLMQLDYCSKSFDDVFEGRHRTNLIMEEYAYYSRKGIDELLDKCQLDEISKSDIIENTIPIKDISMRYIPSSKRIKDGLGDREIIANSGKIMKLFNDAGTYNFIDCLNGERTMVKNILSHADVIVVNMCQGMNVDKLSITEKMREKAVFLVGKYDDDSKEDINSICSKYNIRKNQIGYIPYNIEFHDAMQEGRAVSFISKNILSRRTDSNFDFINNVYKAADLILRKAGYVDGN